MHDINRLEVSTKAIENAIDLLLNIQDEGVLLRAHVLGRDIWTNNPKVAKETLKDAEAELLRLKKDNVSEIFLGIKKLPEEFVVGDIILEMEVDSPQDDTSKSSSIPGKKVILDARIAKGRILKIEQFTFLMNTESWHQLVLVSQAEKMYIWKKMSQKDITKAKRMWRLHENKRPINLTKLTEKEGRFLAVGQKGFPHIIIQKHDNWELEVMWVGKKGWSSISELQEYPETQLVSQAPTIEFDIEAIGQKFSTEVLLKRWGIWTVRSTTKLNGKEKVWYIVWVKKRGEMGIRQCGFVNEPIDVLGGLYEYLEGQIASTQLTAELSMDELRNTIVENAFMQMNGE